MGKDAYYFSHDANAHDDDKCILLIEHLGMEGYGIFWLLIEFLRNQSDFKYNLQLLPALARRFNTDIEKVNDVVHNYNLFIIDENMFFSESLNGRMDLANVKREAGRVAAKARWNKHLEPQDKPPENNTDMRPQCEPNATAMRPQCEPNAIKRNIKGNMKHEKETKDIKSVKKEIEITHSLQIFVRDNFPTVSKLKTQLTEKDCEKLVTDFDKNVIRTVLEQMENYKPLLTKYQSVNLTLRNWIKNELERTNASNKPAYKPNSNGNSTYSKRLELTLDDLERSERENFIVGAN